ncbi:MAG: 30S ribosomal protein S6 [Cytophagales bacterium]
MKHYETLFIITPILSDQQINKVINKFKNLISNNSEIINEKTIGLKKLAYPIKKKTTGFYQIFEFKSDLNIVKNLEIEYKKHERIIRFLTKFLDKYGIKYNEINLNKK